MSFLNPWLWLGATLLAVPVWLHLVQRPSSSLRLFSTLRFLFDEPVPLRQPLRLRNPFLLALRALALLAVVAGFTWPFLRRAPPVAVTESRVHVLDNTLSRQVDDGMRRDRDRIRVAVASAGRETQDAVIVVGAQARVLAGFGDAREKALAALDSVGPGFERGSYLEALRLASGLLEGSLGEKKTILFYGDGQENQWSENETAPPFLKGVKVELASGPDLPSRPSVFLGEPAAQRIHAGERSYVALTIRLGHQGPAAAATLHLEANGRRILDQTVDLIAQPPVVVLQAQWEEEAERWVEGELRVEGTPDALGADNRTLFALPPVREGTVALLARSSYLRTALSPEVMRGRWAAHDVDLTRPTEALLAEELADAVVVEAGYLQSQGARELVMRHLNNGRGAILVVDRVTPLVRGFLRELGFEVEPSPAETTTAFRYVAAEHPLFRPFVSSDFGNLAGVRLRGPTALRATSALPLAFGESGEGLVFEGLGTRGRLLVLTFGFTRAQTNWPLDPTFVPFLDLCLAHVRADSDIETSVEPGVALALPLPRGVAARELVLRDGETVLARAPVGAEGVATLRAPRAPGLYTISFDDLPTERRLLAVNASPRESELRYTSEPAALTAWQMNTAEEPKPEAPPVADPAASAAGQRVWWWLLVAGIALLSTETLVVALARRAT